MENALMLNKKGQTGGLITGLVFGIATLVVGIIIAFVVARVGPGNSHGKYPDVNLAGHWTDMANLAGLPRIMRPVTDTAIFMAVPVILKVVALRHTPVCDQDSHLFAHRSFCSRSERQKNQTYCQ